MIPPPPSLFRQVPGRSAALRLRPVPACLWHSIAIPNIPLLPFRALLLMVSVALAVGLLGAP